VSGVSAAYCTSTPHLCGMRCRAARLWLSVPYAEMGVPAQGGRRAKRMHTNAAAAHACAGS
jgi:hypothetical protein